MTDHLIQLLPSLQGKTVYILGDIMLDRYLFGTVERISPEAPVPVVHITEEKRLLGGAANVAKNIVSLGGKAHLISICGNDAEGVIIQDLLQKESIVSDLEVVDYRPTTIKTRVISQNQQIVRFDKEEFTEIQNETTKKLLARLFKDVSDGSVIILSDYGKGVISKTLVRQLQNYFLKQHLDIKILVDPVVKNYTTYQKVFLLTPNTLEATQCIGVGNTSDFEKILSVGSQIIKRLSCNNLIITMGPKGMILFDKEGSIYQIPTMARNVFDVTGAGDTVIATIGLALSAGCSLFDSTVLSNYAAGLVVAEIGTASISIHDLQNTIQSNPLPPIQAL